MNIRTQPFQTFLLLLAFGRKPYFCEKPKGAQHAAALDYLIGEKLLTFAEVAERSTEFMQELPDFLQ